MPNIKMWFTSTKIVIKDSGSDKVSPCHTTLRQQLFFSLLDIPETISLNLLIFGSVNLNDEENNAVFKSVQTFIIKSKRFTL